ncbi:MAG: 4Fe-4S binding protein [Desulfovibrio sp.]|nr:4Fe-4S binding protein [Desulfovibrio sp.]
MLRRIIRIDEDKCNGCGLCAEACHEAAIGIVDGKAKLLRDDFCDGLGNCLPACPEGAISFEEREAAPFDEEAVKRAKEKEKPLPCGCPGSRVMTMQTAATEEAGRSPDRTPRRSRLGQWPIQLRLVPVTAPYLDGADLLVSADCCAYAHGDFHDTFMNGRVTIIACPKLDDREEIAEKMARILSERNIKSVTVVRMEVPCCGGIQQAVAEAASASGKALPVRVVTLGIKGNILP